MLISSAQSTHCFKNIAKTLAKRSQLKLANIFITKQIFRCRNDIGTCQITSVDQTDSSVSSVLLELGLGLLDVIYTATWVTVGHYTLHIKDYIIYDSDRNMPKAGQIECIVTFTGNIYFVLKCIRVEMFDPHFHGHLCSYPGGEGHISIKIQELKYTHPMQIQEVMFEGEELDVLTLDQKYFEHCLCCLIYVRYNFYSVL